MAKTKSRAGSRSAARKSKPAHGPARKKSAAPRRGKVRKASDAVRPIVTGAGKGEQMVVSSMQLARRAMQKKADQDRKDRLAEYKKSLAAARAKGLRLGPSGQLRVIAEGDSWFDYPRILGTGGGVVSHLSSLAKVNILNMAHYGDEVRTMMGLEQRVRLEQLLGARDLGTFDVLLFSGGGNDIVGDHMVLWTRAFQPGMSPADAIDTQRFRDVMAIVEMGYRDLIAVRDALSPQTHIVTHSYDFPIPSTRGVCGVGPWLKPALDFRGWTATQDQALIVRSMLEQFDRLMQALAASAPRVTHVSTQGLLDAATEWHNEIHPNRSGFAKVARAINNALAGVLPAHFHTV